MAQPNDGAVSEESVYRMPYEGSETTVEAAAESLFDILDLDDDEATEGESGSEAEEPGDEPGDDAELEESDDESEDDSESDDEEDDDGDEDEEPAAEKPKTFKVKVDGEEQEVTLDELLNGYSRTADYTRKTQAAAELRKQIEAEAAEVRGARERYTTLISELESTLQTQMPAEPDWATLREQNPAEFAAQWAEHQQARANLAALQAERNRLEIEARNDWIAQQREVIAAENEKLAEVIPEWKNPDTAKAEKTEMAKYARETLGFTDQELSRVTDHRLLLLLRKARLYDKSTSEGKAQLETKKKKTAKVLQPGARDGNPRATRQKTATQRAMNRLAKTGRVEDAAHAIEGLMDD